MAKKLILDVDDFLWGKVAKFKISKKLKNNNSAVEKLLRTALRNW